MAKHILERLGHAASETAGKAPQLEFDTLWENSRHKRSQDLQMSAIKSEQQQMRTEQQAQKGQIASIVDSQSDLTNMLAQVKDVVIGGAGEMQQQQRSRKSPKKKKRPIREMRKEKPRCIARAPKTIQRSRQILAKPLLKEQCRR